MRRLSAIPNPIKSLLKTTSILAIAILLAAGTFVHHSSAATPSFKQAKANEIGSGTSNSVAFTSANTAGDLIVVYLIWNNTNTVTLSDSRGNTYAAATSRTTWGSNYSTQAFYAKNIAAGTNTVKATFATSINSFAIVQAHEYAGLDKTNPLDNWVGGSGSGTAMNSGSLTTTATNDLLFAGSGSVGSVKAIGSTYTGRLTTSGNRTMDKTAATVGSYNATATNSGGGWTLQLLAFKADSGTDTTPPTAPTNVTATPVSASQVDLSWTAASDNVGVTGYQIERCQGAGCTSFATLTSASNTSYSDTNLSASTTYNYRVKATDAAGNASSYSNTVTATTPANPDAEAPTSPANLSASNTTETQTTLSWDASTDNVGVAGYKVYRNNVQIGASATTTYQASGLTPNTSYSYTVSAFDAAGNESTQSGAVAVTTLPDNTAPGVPSSVAAQASSPTQATVSWSASSDNVGVTGYKVFRDGVQVADVSTTGYQDTTLIANTTYAYTVSAYDGAGNESPQSAAASVTTPSTPTQNTCPLPAYPTPSCTGVPSGTAFTNTVNGDYTVTTAGQTIDAWHVTGSIIVKATGVVIKNSQVDNSITNDGIASSSFSVVDSTVGPATGCAGASQPNSLWGHDFTAARVNLHGHADGIDMSSSNVSVSDSFIQPCFLPGSIVGGDGYHTDGFQDLCGASCVNLSLTHNTFDARAYYNGQPMGNSALNLGSSADGLHLGGVTLKDNLFMGGSYTTDLRWDYGANWVVTSNAWVSGAYTYAPISTEGTCSHQVWSGNSLVNIDSSYAVTGTVAATGCVD